MGVQVGVGGGGEEGRTPLRAMVMQHSRCISAFIDAGYSYSHCNCGDPRYSYSHKVTATSQPLVHSHSENAVEAVLSTPHSCLTTPVLLTAVPLTRSSVLYGCTCSLLGSIH